MDGDALYEIEELKIKVSGKALQNTGLLLPKLLDFGSWTWRIGEVK